MIRQLTINLYMCTSPSIIYKITPFLVENYRLKSFDTTSFEPTNKNSIQYPKCLTQQIRLYGYKDWVPG